MSAAKVTREQTLALVAAVRAAGITDGTGTLYTVCEQALRDSEGTVERVREIWAEATGENS